ncbi:hypothetical protein TIFTF001_029022 [Ficus carica]|uniref:Uncharacterized protein n=1 Tax=Ficus carica TaxID=3494 RepID=A0AA88DQT3_FICCA|nr:hypothetical protein TIFTF001_029022 [Ficus carica]
MPQLKRKQSTRGKRSSHLPSDDQDIVGSQPAGSLSARSDRETLIYNLPTPFPLKSPITLISRGGDNGGSSTQRETLT